MKISELVAETQFIDFNRNSAKAIQDPMHVPYFRKLAG
jgi:hypothetical protein